MRDKNGNSSRRAGTIEKRIGAIVRERRLEIKMSQETLAARLKLTFQQVQKYEKGVNRIAFSRMLEIATILGKPLAEFDPDAKKKTASRRSSSVSAGVLVRKPKPPKVPGNPHAQQ